MGMGGSGCTDYHYLAHLSSSKSKMNKTECVSGDNLVLDLGDHQGCKSEDLDPIRIFSESPKHSD